MEPTIEDIQHFIRAERETPMLYLTNGTTGPQDDPIYKSMKSIVMRIWPDTEDHVWAISNKVKEMFFSLRTMEDYDVDKIVNTFKKYEIKGSSGGVSGDRTYGYDKSRVDRKLIRRRRAN